jgi:hypothetical protein
MVTSTGGTASGWPRATASRPLVMQARQPAIPSAREAYYRACNYYRVSYLPLYGAPTDPQLVAAFEAETATFLKGAALSDIPIEAVEIPFEETTLPGYFVTVEDSGAPGRPSFTPMATTPPSRRCTSRTLRRPSAAATTCCFTMVQDRGAI